MEALEEGPESAAVRLMADVYATRVDALRRGDYDGITGDYDNHNWWTGDYDNHNWWTYGSNGYMNYITQFNLIQFSLTMALHEHRNGSLLSV
jgi:hypothetical protein